MTSPPRQHLTGIVVGDTPVLNFALRDRVTGAPLDMSAGTTTIKLRVQRIATPAPAVKEVDCGKLVGRELADGSIDSAPPYDVAGAGGRAQAACAASVFDVAGDYDGEVRVTFSATSQQQTPYALLRIHVRNPVGA